jgi:hypothetical protein
MAEDEEASTDSDRCAGCGKELTGACCSRAYWSRHAPLPRDGWYPLKKVNGWYLYGEFLPGRVKWRPR